MNYLLYVYIIFFISVVYLTDFVKTECKVTLANDFSDPQPIFYKDKTLWRPDKTGTFTLKEGGIIKASCSSSSNAILFGDVAFSNDSVVIECVDKQTFRVGLWESAFKDIRCTNQPTVQMKKHEKLRCFPNSDLHRVGYNVGTEFIAIYDACFDFHMFTTHYVVHTLRPMAAFVQPERQETFFGSKFLYGNISIQDIYSYDYQKNKVDSIIGEKVTGEFLNEDLHLKEMFLLPPADLPLHIEQRAAYHYVNIVPRWKCTVGGDWDILERALRVRVMKKGSEAIVYSGTFGAATLPAENGVHRELYMDVSHAYTSDIIPVPLYLYKLVFDPNYHSATVFISINNPHYNKYELEQLVFCDDVCNNNPKFTWLKWQKNDNITSFCCKYAQVKEYMFSLPSLHVEGLFY